MSYDYHCDCSVDVYLIAIAKSAAFNIHNYFKHIDCRQPLTLANRTVSDVPLTEFACDLSERCPPGCRCVHRPINYTVHVYCSAANLSSLPLELPSPSSMYTYKLDFSRNKLLRRLEHRPYIASTSVLDVSNCAINLVTLNAWREFTMMPSQVHNFEPSRPDAPNIVVVTPLVFLHGNKIETLSLNVTDINLTSVYFTLNNNPWKCSCNNRWMIAWFNYMSSLSNVGDVLCASPSRLKGKSILQSNEDDFCEDPIRRMLKIILSSTLSIITGLLIFSFAVYCLRVRLYKRWNFHPFDRDECAGENMDYDVFFSCSSEDEDPHGRHILELMESKGYRVCYHERDFRPGLIVDNMLQSILHSKRTVCFISHNFIQR